MKRVPVVLVLVLVGCAAGLLFAVPSQAHPLGNFSVNHIAEVSVSAGQVDVRYTLDQAEIPTFQERGLDDRLILARKRAEVVRRLVLTVDGRRVALAPRPGARISHPPGQGGPGAAAGGVRVGRPARALARPRQDDGRRLPRRHAEPRSTRSRSARSRR